MEFVKVRHPDAGEATVPESALGHYAGMGWVPVEDDLAALSKAELERLAEEKGVPVANGAKKSDLVEAVAAVEQPPTPA